MRLCENLIQKFLYLFLNFFVWFVAKFLLHFLCELCELCAFVRTLLKFLSQIIREPSICLIHDVLFSWVDVVAELIDKGFYTGKAFVQACVKTP